MKKIKMVIKERHIRFPTLPVVGISLPLDLTFRLPSLQGLNFGSRTKSVVFATLLFSGLVISGAVYFAIQGIDPAPVWPQSASYDAATAQRLGQESLGVGAEIPADTQQGTMTLELNIGGARIDKIVFSNMDIGKASGLTDAIQISASSGIIICESLVLEDVEATDFLLATSTAYSFAMENIVADGLSVSPTLSSDPVQYSFGSNRGALTIPEVSGGTFDRILISSNSTSTVGTIEFKNVRAYGAGISITDINCGSISIKGSASGKSVFGDGTGIDTPSYTINSTLKVSSSSLVNNVERPISIK
jgi:hypothetical protein